jgi:DNA-binding SARP family transcriptional activator
VTLGQSRLEELIALLAIQPGGVLKRAQIAYQFWPDSGEQQARTNTRNLLHKLRHAWPDLGDAITIDGDAVTWRYDAVILVDVHSTFAA